MKKVLFALVLLATLLFSGDYELGFKAYNKGIYKTAIEFYQKATNQGFSKAQYNFGNMY